MQVRVHHLTRSAQGGQGGDGRERGRGAATWGGHGRGVPSSSSLLGSGGMLMRCQALLQGLNTLLSCCGTFQALSLLICQLQQHRLSSQNVTAADAGHTDSKNMQGELGRRRHGLVKYQTDSLLTALTEPAAACMHKH